GKLSICHRYAAPFRNQTIKSRKLQCQPSSWWSWFFSRSQAVGENPVLQTGSHFYLTNLPREAPRQTDTESLQSSGVRQRARSAVGCGMGAGRNAAQARCRNTLQCANL